MLEIEPHYQTVHGLGARAGVNLPLIAWRHARGEPQEVPGECREHVRLLDLREDLKGYWRGYRRSGEWSAWGYVRSLCTRKTYFRLYDPIDRGPFLYSGANYLLQKLHVSRKPAVGSGASGGMKAPEGSQARVPRESP
jgi:hypothetical protein